MMKRTRKPTHPGAILKELYLDELHIGISEFADRIGISRKTVSGIVNGHRGVTPEMAVRFSKALPNTGAEMWLNLQKSYDLFEAEQRLSEVKIVPVLQPAMA